VVSRIQSGWWLMFIEELWRYPVKSMAGEPLQTAELTEAGVRGDRIVQVRNAAGRIRHGANQAAATSAQRKAWSRRSSSC